MRPRDAAHHGSRAVPRYAEAQARALVDAMAEAESAVLRGYPADQALNAFFRARRHLGSRDRRMITDNVFSAFRWRGWVGALQERGPRILLVESALIQSDQPLPAALRHLAQSNQSTLDESEPALRAQADDPVIALHAAARRAERILGRPCPIESLLPEWFISRISSSESPEQNSPDWLPRFIAWSRTRPPLWLHALGISASDAALKIRNGGWDAEPSDVVPGAVRLAGAPPLPALLKSTGLRAYAQDLASQQIVAACQARPGERWWDACAGGGGKTIGLLDAVGGSGEVWATDIRAASLDELKTRAHSLKLAPPHVQALDASKSAPSSGPFDGVLVDAPCTGSGTWARNPDAPWRLTPKTMDQRLNEQRAILNQVACRVRPGGRLVYATCAVGRPENEDQTARFLREHPEFRLDSQMQLWPWDGPQNGSYCASFTRKP